MSDALDRDYTNCRTVLLGTWNYTHLGPMPAAEHSLNRMTALLTGPLCGWPEDRIVIEKDRASLGELPDELVVHFRWARDVALFYYVGHGQYDSEDRLCLALGDSQEDPDRRTTTSLTIDAVRHAFKVCRATTKIAILDCCWAGLAAQRDGFQGPRTVPALPSAPGVYLMMSSGAFSTSWCETTAESRKPQTYFTKYLVDTVERGIPGQPEGLTLNSIFHTTAEALAAAGKPVPGCRASDCATHYVFARNASPARIAPVYLAPAYHDSLTDLHNRLGFQEAANEVLRYGSTPCAVLIIELGLLSAVNHALGQVWGDRVVLGAGERLCRTLDPQALIARLDGDTFAALLTDVDVHQALEVAEWVQAALSKPYPVDKLAVECSAVVGVALTGIEPTRDANVLLQRADVALRVARGADQTVRSYQPSMGQILMRRFQLVAQFRQALDTEQVDVYFQPQLALSTRQVIGVEALVRWEHPEFGTLNPAEFVALVETTGLIDPLTDYVLDRSLAQCRSWLDRGMSLAVSVNLSVRNLADTEFPRRVGDALRRHRVPAAFLGLELTESAVMSDPQRALPVLRGLHGLGVRIAVDNFGTGYSSLAYLRRLPVDEVKIDKSFVLGLARDLGDLAVVRAIIELGHALGLNVVANGVEQDATWDQLVEMGCDVAQGYLISRPLGPDRFDAWLAAWTVRATNIHDETVLTLVTRSPMKTR